MRIARHAETYTALATSSVSGFHTVGSLARCSFLRQHGPYTRSSSGLATVHYLPYSRLVRCLYLNYDSRDSPLSNDGTRS